ncbi:YeeE/YedE family protein [Paraburkholderia sp. UCT2]|uniref:YeeE/YedE family protein n=1 Tax=Paraburkholderia sp. UCT2 TaxID=2615208 RepID=UPI0016565389|nr:YeeE/YedE family protein [Paraburkholderia sp. UCT2]MBC8727719.1 YeeE/YedE family protein [Paraburkholderia sp. UCT2]
MIDLDHFTPIASLCGGLLIGAVAAAMVLLLGRIAGISGIVGGLLRWTRQDGAWRVAFVAGLVAAAVIARAVGAPVAITVDASWPAVIAAGFLVGIGTRYGSGCTSGHGVCGISRGATRSLVATATFMAAGFVTVYIMRHLLGA